MESVAQLGHNFVLKKQTKKKLKFGFNKDKEETNDDAWCVLLEMQMAELMAQQETSSFRFDMDAAERIRKELVRLKISLKNFGGLSLLSGKVFT